jgi:hypothetical protein
MTNEVQPLELTLATAKAAATAAAKKWFYESFDDDLLEKMEKADVIAQAEGFSISVIATLQLEIEQAFDAAVRTAKDAAPCQPSTAAQTNSKAGADEWAEALLKMEVVREALTSSDSVERLKNMEAGQLMIEGIAILRTLRHQEQHGAPTVLRFPASLRKMWSGGEVQQWLEDRGPFYRSPVVSPDDSATLQRVYEAFGIGELARTPSTLFTCIGNTKHFSNLLAAVEREYFMVPGVPSDEPEDEGCEPDNVCLVNRWGSSMEEYVAQFGKALLDMQSRTLPLGTFPATTVLPASQF